MWDNIVLSGFADEIDPSLDEQIRVLKKLGMNHIEMRGVNGKGLVEYTLEEAKEIKKRLDAEGFALSSVGSPIGKIKITDDFEPHMELYKHTVDLAHLMEAKYIRMFSFFMPEGCEDYSPYKDEVMARLGKFVDYAKANDIILLHENEKDIYGDVASRCLEIQKNFYCDHFKAVFDFANFVQCKQDTLEAYEMMKPYVEYIHIKDARWDDASVVPPGIGDGHVAEILAKFKAAGYLGYLSLESHLADFAGFAALEMNASQKKKLGGEEAFTLAHDSLVKIIESL